MCVVHFEQYVAAQHVHLDGDAQHRVVLALLGVVALQQAATRRLAGAGELGQIQIDEAQLVVAAAALALLAHRDAHDARIEDAGGRVGGHFAQELEHLVPFDRVVFHLLTARNRVGGGG